MINGREVPSDSELAAARNVVSSFLISLKNYDLYPSDHGSSRKLLEGIHNRLDNFLSLYGEMNISIERNRLLYKSEIIYEAQASDDNLAFLLYRDGLLWVEFLAGLTIDEIKVFFTILNKYKVSHDEPEDDIVTALWDANMPHIRYEAKELFFEDVPLLDFSRLNKQAAESGEVEKDKSAASSPESMNVLDMASGDEHRQWWSLAPEEFALLEAMVWEAEESVRQGDLLQVLFFVLTKQESQEDFVVILDFLKDEWRLKIEQGDFAPVVHHLIILKELRKSPPQERPWLTVPLAGFFKDISNPGFLSPLAPAISRSKVTPEWLLLFREFLLLLEPQAMPAMANLLLNIKDQEVLDVLFDVMVKLGRVDLAPLKELLEAENELVVLQAARVLGRLEGAEAGKLVRKAMRHSSSKVRRYALRTHLKAGNPRIDEVFRFIEDPDLTARDICLAFLGRERNRTVEELLLNYLQRESLQALGEDHLHNCYIALGRCGSVHCLPFLKGNLLGKGWKAILGGDNSIRQLGAIQALKRLQAEGATEILEQGAASFVPLIRKSCRTALAKRGRL